MSQPRFSYVIFGYRGNPWVYSKYPQDYLDFTFGTDAITYTLPMELHCNQQDLMGRLLLPYPRFTDNRSSFSLLLEAQHKLHRQNDRWVIYEHHLVFRYTEDLVPYLPLITSILQEMSIFDIPGIRSTRAPTCITLEAL